MLYYIASCGRFLGSRDPQTAIRINERSGVGEYERIYVIIIEISSLFFCLLFLRTHTRTLTALFRSARSTILVIYKELALRGFPPPKKKINKKTYTHEEALETYSTRDVRKQLLKNHPNGINLEVRTSIYTRTATQACCIGTYICIEYLYSREQPRGDVV